MTQASASAHGRHFQHKQQSHPPQGNLKRKKKDILKTPLVSREK